MVNDKDQSKKIRIGFTVTEDLSLPAWEYAMLKQLSESSQVELFFLTTKPASFPKKSYLLNLFERFEQRWFRSMPDAFKLVKIKNEGIPIYNYEEALTLFKGLKPDIIYKSFYSDIIKDLIDNPTHGVWSIHFGKGEYKDAIPPAFREVMNNCPVTGSTLEMRSNNERIILYDCLTSTVPFSVKNNLNHIAWKSSSFLPLRVLELIRIGPEPFFNHYKVQTNSNKSNSKRQAPKLPGNFEMSWLFLKNSLGYLKSKIATRQKNERFSIHLSAETGDLTKPGLLNTIQLPLPSTSFHADPFLMKKEERWYVFFEDFDLNKNKAHICVSELVENNFSPPAIVLERPYHLSYPFVFSWQGEYFMIPETNANRTVELYKATEFPFQWEFVMNLMEDIILIDATLVYHNNKWWMFGNTCYHPQVSTNDQLLIFHSDHLLSTYWKPHARNPVVTDISNCRPAGRIFSLNGELYRPAQNNASWIYGYGVNMNRIISLTETDFSEECIWNIKAGDRWKAIHHFDQGDNFIIVDGIPAS